MGKCSCIYIGEYDPPVFHVAKIQTARKYHMCCECGRDIFPSEEYERVSGKWETRIATYKTCSDCLSIRNEMFCEGWYYEQLREYLWEHLQEMLIR